MFLGLVFGLAFLMLMSNFPMGDISLSIVSGTTLTITGFRVHHWLLGVGCLFVGWFFKGKMGSLILGLGLAFFIDDLTDLRGIALASM